MEEKEPYEINQENNRPVTDEEWTIHSLNIHGTFFQYQIAKTVATYKKSKLSLCHTEYPIEFSNDIKQFETRIDVLGYFKKTRNDSAIYLIIECKKCNPEFVNWVFFPRIKQQLSNSKSNTITILQNSFYGSNNGDNSTCESGYITKEVQKIDVAGDCREVRGTYQGDIRNKTKTSNSSISDAAYQVLLGTHGFSKEQISPTLGQASLSIRHIFNKKIYYFPIIVTTANLYKINFDLSDINLSNGEIKLDKCKLEFTPYIFYEYPISPYLQIMHDQNPIDPYLVCQDLSIFRHILVVNSNSFTEVLDLLMNNEDFYFSN
ncbi:MAG: hypothetical protein KQI81_08655 [Deltaproteobacteria bacterium]|nr:hypothetical protein [Deltaproteobacteria bacterium]